MLRSSLSQHPFLFLPKYDLGGVQALTPQRIDLDRVGLADGATYRVRLFYAQRQNVISSFRFRTNVVLESVGTVQVNTPCD